MQIDICKMFHALRRGAVAILNRSPSHLKHEALTLMQV